MMRSFLATLLLALSLAGGGSAIAATPGSLTGTIADFSRGSIKIAVDGLPPAMLTVPNTSAQKQLRAAHKGDEISFEANDVTAPTILTAIDSLSRPVSQDAVILFLFIAAAIVLVVSWLLLGRCNPLIGLDKRYSNSQTQMALWFAAVAVVYVATNLLRAVYLGGAYIGGVNVGTHLIALTGLSAFTFGAARVITTQKSDDATAATAAAAAAVAANQPNTAPPPTPKTEATGGPSIRDLVRNDQNQADLGDFQMIMVTLGAVIIFLCQSYWYLTSLPIAQAVTLPDVDSALLATFGLGQGAYLIKKAGSPAGSG